MNYLLLMYPNEELFRQLNGTHEECVESCEELVSRLDSNGQFVAAGILEPVSQARSVQVRQGRRLVTDGPFAETREHFAGYLLIEAKSLDEALAIAAEHPVAQAGTVEVRPVMEISFLT